MGLKLLANRSGHRKAIEEARAAWIDDLLEYLGLDLEVVHSDRQDLALEYLLTNHVDIVDYPSIDAIKVSFEGELVGEWAGPTNFELKRDEEYDELYYEIEIDCWSVIEEEIV